MLHLLLAAEDVEHAEVMAANWLPAVTALLVFGIAFAILYIKVWPQITKALDDRNNKILEEIRSAEQARAAAHKAQQEYEQSLSSAREEANEMIAKAKADAKAAAESLRRNNEVEIADMKQRASRDIEAAKHAAITELHAEAATLASSIASKILKREIQSSDQSRLIDEALSEMRSVRSA